MSDDREAARAIFLAAVAAVDPGPLVRAALEGFLGRGAPFRDPAGRTLAPPDGFFRPGARITVVGAGKATAPMAAAAEDVLGDAVDGGVVVVKREHGLPLRRIALREAGHPTPDEDGVAGARAVLEDARRASSRGADGRLLCLISGGGSALLPAPRAGLTLADLQAVTDALLRSGAPIEEMNCVRKHLSEIAGGGLARAAAPAPGLTLILSDVLGDPIDAIASGPTAADPTTFGDALAVLDRRALRARVPPCVVETLERGARGLLPETLKAGDPAARAATNLVIGNNARALAAAGERARALGWRVRRVAEPMRGEARAMGLRAAGALIAVPAEERPLCVLWGGETTVTVRGDGRGGRNQEMALAAAGALEGSGGITLLCGGTDGNDGPTDAAGALVDGGTIGRGRAPGRDAAACLERNDSYRFLDAAGDLLRTGPTRTNVMDVAVGLVRA